jgi:type 1 fimbria pilin
MLGGMSYHRLRRFAGGVLLSSLIVISNGGLAATLINMSGMIAPSSCVIDEGKAIDVNFGDEVLTTRIDGINYKKEIEYKLKCENNTSDAIRMKIVGSPSFKPSALETNKEGLGVELQVNDKPIMINDWLYFTYPDSPRLQAVPIKKVGSMLSGGEFVATAALLVDYQ